VSKPVTPESLRDQLDVLLDAERRMLEADLPKQAAWVRREAEKLRRAAHTVGIAIEERGLSRGEQYATNATMEASANAAPPKKRTRGRRPRLEGPVADICAALGGVSMADLSKLSGYAEGTIRSWASRGEIPSDAQSELDVLVKKHQDAKAKAASKKPAKSAK